MRVIERNKKGRKYYYIQHSFRKGGKIITRERYLGKIIPENVEKIMQDMKKESEKDLYANLEKIRKNFQKEWKGLPESAKEREKEEIAIAFTYNTNAIEGSAITLGETREIIHDKTAPKKPLRDIKETEAHSKVFFDMLNSKEKISASLMLKWHKDVFGETKPDIAGKSRTYLVRVGDYIASDWQDIGAVMKELVRFIRSSDANAVELAARVHYRFEKIHPFG
ncbi:MAG: Fic family protein, partial [Candidatus Aenigmarchaeota archaeon]|nr:Fic family protein [Candidatus Aenigmarchaeota archaeon]